MIDQSPDILIVGAGQARLALGHALQGLNYRLELVENHNRVGDVWRKRYDSLFLFTPRSTSSLPGLPMPGEQDGYASKDEFADYLEKYANHFPPPP